MSDSEEELPPGNLLPDSSQEALKSMVFSGADSTLRLQELPRRVPDAELVRSNGPDVQHEIGGLLFFRLLAGSCVMLPQTLARRRTVLATT